MCYHIVLNIRLYVSVAKELLELVFARGDLAPTLISPSSSARPFAESLVLDAQEEPDLI